MKLDISEYQKKLTLKDHKTTDNYRFVKNIIKKYPNLLEFVSQDFKNNYKIVKYAVKRSNVLKFASENLRDNYFIVKYAIKYHAYSIIDASDDLKQNHKLLKHVIRKRGPAILFHSYNIELDYKLVKYAIKKNTQCFIFLPTKFKKYNLVNTFLINKNINLPNYLELEVIGKQFSYKNFNFDRFDHFLIILLKL